MRDRAVSEVVSFVLVFSLIAVTVGVVYVAGGANLEQARTHERIQNAERAFDVFDDNVGDITSQSAPNRGTEIKLADARLYFGSVTELNVTTAGGGSDEPYSVSLLPVIYQPAGETKLIYEAGMVLRSDRDGSVRREEPPVLFGQERTLIHYVQTRKMGSSPASVAGDRTVLIRTAGGGKDLLAGRTNGPYVVWYNVTTTHTAAWESFLEGEISDAGVAVATDPNGYDTDPCQVRGGTLTCKFETERLYVAVSRMDVAFS